MSTFEDRSFLKYAVRDTEAFQETGIFENKL